MDSSKDIKRYETMWEDFMQKQRPGAWDMLSEEQQRAYGLIQENPKDIEQKLTDIGLLEMPAPNISVKASPKKIVPPIPARPKVKPGMGRPTVAPKVPVKLAMVSPRTKIPSLPSAKKGMVVSPREQKSTVRVGGFISPIQEMEVPTSSAVIPRYSPSIGSGVYTSISPKTKLSPIRNQAVERRIMSDSNVKKISGGFMIGNKELLMDRLKEGRDKDSYTIPELKDFSKELGLKSKGNKTDIVMDIRDALQKYM